MTLSDILWGIWIIIGVGGFFALTDEMFPNLWPAVWRFTRRRRWRDRHPIIKDWRE
jgi:hypothetical protein